MGPPKEWRPRFVDEYLGNNTAEGYFVRGTRCAPTSLPLINIVKWGYNSTYRGYKLYPP